MSPREITPEQRDHVLALYDDNPATNHGWIARKTGLPTTAVSRVIDEHTAPTHPPARRDRPPGQKAPSEARPRGLLPRPHDRALHPLMGWIPGDRRDMHPVLLLAIQSAAGPPGHSGPTGDPASTQARTGRMTSRRATDSDVCHHRAPIRQGPEAEDAWNRSNNRMTMLVDSCRAPRQTPHAFAPA